MARFDRAWCLARMRLELRRTPFAAVDELLTDTNGYDYLSEAQEHWLAVMSAEVPQVNYGAPTLMTTADAGLTYTFGTDPVTGAGNLVPLGSVEVYYRNGAGLPMVPGSYWDANAEYVHEGDRIRFPMGRARTFSSGPYARFVSPPLPITSTQDPTIKPQQARILLVYRACALFCEGPGKEDPTPFYDKEQKAWLGDMERGMPGLLAVLRSQFNDIGAEAQGSGISTWYNSADLGNFGAS